MKLSEKIAKRILFFCDKKQISVNKLAILSELTQSTLDSIINGKSQNPQFGTIEKVCKGLGITLKEFFDSPEFENDDFND